MRDSFSFYKKMQNLFFFSLPVLGLFSGCVSEEQIKQRKMVDDLALQVVQSEKNLTESQKLSADISLKLDELQAQISTLQGKIEELEHQTKPAAEGIPVSENLDRLNQSSQTQAEEILNIKKTLEEHRAFLKEITNSLEKFQKSSSTQKKSPGKNNTYETAMDLYQSKKYKEAKELFLDLLDKKQIKYEKENRVLLNLGLIEYNEGNYSGSLVYFTKIYPKKSGSPFAANALLHIGKSLGKLGKKAEAKEAYQELVDKYPKSSPAKEAKTLLNQ